MLKGRFGDTSGRPFIEGKLYIPSLSVDVPVSFLVDTGADTTSQLPVDVELIGLDASKLPVLGEGCVGIGGKTECHKVEAVVVFSDDTYIYAYEINLTVIPPCEGLEDTPSLLGRDILDKWSMLYDPVRDRLEFTVRKCDLKTEIGP